MRILLIEDEKITRKTLTDFISKEDYQIESAGDGLEALEIFEKNKFDVVVTDLRLPGMNGLDILKTIKEKTPDCTVIIITAYATVETAIEALKLGAYDYLTKPFNPDRLISMLNHIRQLNSVLDENIKLKKKLRLFENKSIIGGSPAIKKVVEVVHLVAKNDYTVLIQGESGTGKEICARAVHRHSRRAQNNFVAVNCAAIPESLLESELFGHEKGAFTGAIKRHAGYFERADKGTLFIDDIDDFPFPMQVKLLRVLQEKEIVRVGGSEIIPVDVRIICATKVDLRKRVEEKLFREDLYYRLNIIPLSLPPLRERKEDIPELMEHFFKKHGASEKTGLLTNEIYSALMKHEWLGNVRELENFAERMIALSSEDALNSSILDTLNLPKNSPAPLMEKEPGYPPLEQYMYEREKEIIEWALKKSEGNLTAAAKTLEIPRTTLRSKIDKLFKIPPETAE
jgi:DNA-binding NtrC family response regulator